MQLPITHVDVFSDVPFRGNPVAVVHDADQLTESADARGRTLAEPQ